MAIRVIVRLISAETVRVVQSARNLPVVVHGTRLVQRRLPYEDRRRFQEQQTKGKRRTNGTQRRRTVNARTSQNEIQTDRERLVYGKQI